MLHKLVYIKNYGRFSSCAPVYKECEWDGTFRRVNLIYAPNGSGKTSFAVLLRSLSGDNALVLKKKTFGAASDPEIQFISEDKKSVRFSSKKWNIHFLGIEVFDSFYFEDNLYSIKVDDSPSRLNFFELTSPEEYSPIKHEIYEDIKKITELGIQIDSRKKYLKRKFGPVVRYDSDRRFISMNEERKTLRAKVQELQEKRLGIIRAQLPIYLEKINSYLSIFCDTLRLTEIEMFPNTSNNTISIIYGLEINGYNITIKQRKERDNTSLKYYLSDGDKNALALSFFLAKLSLLPEVGKYCVVVDDPFTSFDSQRKLSTITQLVRLSNKVNQFFLLTHDVHFASDFYRYANCANDCLTLRIANNNGSSCFYGYDIKTEMLTGIQKDLQTMRNYVNGKIIEDQAHLRDVVRCIRPVIEGFFRMKYYNYISENQWLGNFIDLIRDSTQDNKSPFFRLKPLLPELEEVNDYSKVYHHSNPNYYEMQISPQELRIYIKRTLRLIEFI